MWCALTSKQYVCHLWSVRIDFSGRALLSLWRRVLRHDSGKQDSGVRRDGLSHFADSSCGKFVNAMNLWQ